MRSLKTILFLFLALQMKGQITYDTVAWDFDILNVDDGFSAGFAFNITVDSLGYLYAATYHGLDRYDGYEVRHFMHDPNDSLSLPADHVVCVFKDSRNWLWVTLSNTGKEINKGTYLFIDETNTFRKVSDTIFYKLKEDQKGNLWGKTRDLSWSIIEVDSLEGKDQDFRITPITTFFKELSKEERIPEMVLTKDNLWWVLKDTVYAYRLNYDTKSANLKIKKKVDRNMFGYDHNHTALIKDRTMESMWFFSDNACYSLSMETGELLTSHSYPKGMIIKDRKFSLYAHGSDSKGRIFLNIDQLGLVAFDTNLKKFSLIVDKDKNAKKLNVFATSILEDAHQNLWFTTAGYGIYKHTRNRDLFNYFGKEGSISSSISKFYIEPVDKISMFGLGVLSTFDLKNGKLIEEQIFPKRLNIDSSYRVSELTKDTKDQFWLSYRKNGHLKLSPIEDTGIKSSVQINVFADSLNSGKSGIIGFEDESTLWTICFPNNESNTKLQFIKTDVTTNEHTRYDINTSSDFALGGTNRDFFIDQKSRLWVSFSGNGIIQLDTQTGTSRNYYSGDTTATSISSNNVFCFQPDPTYPDSILWIGTGNGLNKYTYDLDAFEVYTTENGLPNNVVYGLLADDHDNLWLSTNYGLCQFNPRSFLTRNFTREDGLQDNEFNGHAYYKDEEGTFYFGGMGGLTYFDPEDFYIDNKESNVVIHTLKIDNQPIRFERNTDPSKKGSYVLEQPLDQTQQIEFNYNQLMITFGFACLDLTKPEYNSFRYKLEGFNDDWIEAGFGHEATFTQLSAGTYTFKVQGRNASNVWNRKGAELIVVMHGPWWESWWFFFLCLLAIVGIIYLTYRYHLKQNEKIFKLRNKISTDLHDEIGSTLSSIALFGSVAETTLETDLSHSKKMLSRINARTTEAMESINDIVWAINSNNDQLKALLKRMRAYIFQLSDASNVEIYFTSDDNITDLKISMAQRKNIYLIYKEAVINAFKYAQCDTIEVKLSKTPSGLQLMIKDNGVGFNTQDALDDFSMGGNGIKNMQLRADELKGKLIITSAIGEGTSVTFSWKPSSKVI